MATLKLKTGAIQKITYKNYLESFVLNVVTKKVKRIRHIPEYWDI